MEEVTKNIADVSTVPIPILPIPVTTSPSASTQPSAEFMRSVRKSCAEWNANFNRGRKTGRSRCFDLQTGTLNFPAGYYKVLPPQATKIGYFPVAVVQGQYCDNFNSYTPTELKYLPLDTVRFGPVCERDFDDNEADDDDTSSSSSSSSSSSNSEESVEIKPATNGNGTDNGNIGMNGEKVPNEEVKIEGSGISGVCGTCDEDEGCEVLIQCAKCEAINHPTCLDLTLDMVPFIKKYDWQCTDCKACVECDDPTNAKKMLVCDCCDRGYHTYCVGLSKIPSGRWHCRVCSVCRSCNATTPAPEGEDEDGIAEWHHKFRADKKVKGYKHYLHSFCAPCNKLYMRGQYCPMCFKCHYTSDDKNLLECLNCDKRVHKECVNRPLQTIYGMYGYMCDVCTHKAKRNLQRRN